MKEIDELLDEITYQTYNIFGSNVDQKNIVEFREYLEDIILFDIISCKKNRIDVFSQGENVTENIKLALIASGISKDGTIPMGKSYAAKTIPITKESHYYAKQRVREIDQERMKGLYTNRMVSAIEYNRHHPNAFPNISELIELGIAQNERNCGYVEDHPEAVSFFEGASVATWMVQRELLEKEGYGDTLAFDICDLIYARPQQKHYQLATAVALKKMAEIDMNIQQYGVDADISNEEIEKTFRNIEVAKITDPEIMKKYERDFKTLIRNQKNNKKRLTLLKNKPIGINAPKN